MLSGIKIFNFFVSDHLNELSDFPLMPMDELSRFGRYIIFIHDSILQCIILVFVLLRVSLERLRNHTLKAMTTWSFK